MALCLRVVTLLSLAGWITSGVLAAPPAPQPVRTFAGHADSVRSVAFSRDGKTLASGSFDKTAKLWNVDSGELLGTLRGHGNAHPAGGNLRPGINRVAFTPDGTILATAGLDGTVKLWDVATKKELRTLRGHSNRVLSVAIAPDGKTLASASEDHSIMIWEIASGQRRSTLQGHDGSIEAVAFDAEGTGLFSGATDGAIKGWNLTEETAAVTIPLGKAINVLAMAPDGKSFVAGQANGMVSLWSVREKLERRVLEGHRAAVFAGAFSPDSKSLVTAGLDGEEIWLIESSGANPRKVAKGGFFGHGSETAVGG